jgi:hypothetical protein
MQSRTTFGQRGPYEASLRSHNNQSDLGGWIAPARAQSVPDLRAEVAALQAQVNALQSTVNTLQTQLSSTAAANAPGGQLHQRCYGGHRARHEAPHRGSSGTYLFSASRRAPAGLSLPAHVQTKQMSARLLRKRALGKPQTPVTLALASRSVSGNLPRQPRTGANT